MELAVARSVVRRHGGNIVMSDRQGGGLVVSIFLPQGTGTPAHHQTSRTGPGETSPA